MLRHLSRTCIGALVGVLVSVGLVTWSTPPAVGAGPELHTAQVIAQPRVAVDDAGNATAVWTAASPGSFVQIYAARRPVGGAWGAPVAISTPGFGATLPDVDAGPDSTATVVWRREDPDNSGSIIESRTYVPTGSGTWGTVTPLSDPGQFANAPSVVIDPAGRTTVVWDRYNGSHSVVQARRFDAGAWSDVEDLSADGVSATEPDVAVDDEGDIVVVWNAEGGDLVQAAQRALGDPWSSVVDIADTTETEAPRVVAQGVGDITAAWTDGDIVASSSFHAIGGWAEPVTLDNADGAKAGLELAVRPSGFASAVWTAQVVVGDGEAPELRAAKDFADGWATPDAVAQGATLPRLSTDQSGNHLISFVGLSDDGLTTRAMTARWITGEAGLRNPTELSSGDIVVMDTAVALARDGAPQVLWTASPAGVWPPTEMSLFVHPVTSGPVAGPSAAMIRPSPNWRNSQDPIPVSWRGVTAGHGVASFDVRVRSARARGTLAAPVMLRSATTQTTLTYAPVGRGRSYCFEARARDNDGRVGTWSRPLCASTPVDDRRMKRLGPWAKVSASKAFAGTLLRARKRGARLTLADVQARRVALLVRVGRGQGKVRVTVGGSSRVIKLAASKKRFRVVKPVVTFSSVRKTTVRVKVVSSGRPVQIDGVLVAPY